MFWMVNSIGQANEPALFYLRPWTTKAVAALRNIIPHSAQNVKSFLRKILLKDGDPDLYKMTKKTFFQKMLDKSPGLCYNIDTIKERGKKL